MKSTSAPDAKAPPKGFWRNLMDTSDNSRQPVSIVLLSIFLLGTVVVLCGGSGTDGYNIWRALIWGFAFCVSGIFLGFLFAIPRVLPPTAMAVAPVKPGTTPDGAGNQAAPARIAVAGQGGTGPSEINSNLVEVSDWLTKIIVGVGLVELKQLPAAAQSVAGFVAPSLGYTNGDGAPVVGGIMLFYSVHGFLIGYVLTRIYLSLILKWADNQVLSQLPTISLQDGADIAMVDMVTQLHERVGDVQKTVGERVTAPADVAAGAGAVVRVEEDGYPAAYASAAARPPVTVARILWVDDILNQSASVIDTIRGPGVLVDQALTTDEALRMLDDSPATYALVITDMYRREAQRHVRNAGVLLTQKVTDKMPHLPVLVYCTEEEKQVFGTAALHAGARQVITSSTRLIGEVQAILHAARPDAW